VRVLLDTHTLLWWLDGDRRLSRRARNVIAADDNAVLVSAASAWEISTKVRLGKLPGAIEVTAELPAVLRQQTFEPLPITIVHALRAGNLPGSHRDPFDRMLIAQAQDEDLALVSNDRVFDVYGVRRVW
jgi:PIN domain nuclease of toxin-antitoxin system